MDTENIERTTTYIKPDDVGLSVIVPYYNEQEVLPELHQRLVAALQNLNISTEIVYVNDGSTDSSLAIVNQFWAEDTVVMSVNLSRNFGKEAAMSAGLAQARGEAVILIDADLQDPPELIPKMVEAWKDGADVVNMKRSERLGETWVKRQSASMFYKLLNRLIDQPIPENVGDFRLLSRRVVNNINQLSERNRYMKGLLNWPGYRQVTLEFQRDARFSGETKWNYFKLFGLAVDGITSFSMRPLRIATFFGALTAMSAFIYGTYILISTMLFGEPVRGFPTLMIVQLGIGGVQLLCIGLLGEYIGRIYVEAKERPIYLIESVTQTSNAEQNGITDSSTLQTAVQATKSRHEKN